MLFSTLVVETGLKEALTNATLLAFPDPDAQTELVNDASGATIGLFYSNGKKGHSHL